MRKSRVRSDTPLFDGQHTIVIAITESSLGGAQVYVHGLAVYLKEIGWCVHVVAGTADWLVESLRSCGIRCTVIAELGQGLRDLAQPLRSVFMPRAFWALMRLLWRSPPDIVHTNSSVAGLLGCIAARLLPETRIVHTSHGTALLQELSVGARRQIRFLEGLIGRAADLRISVCESDLAALTSARALGRARLIHKGVPDHLVSHQSLIAQRRERAKCKGTEAVVGCVANLVPNKDISTFIRAARIVANQNQHVRFVIVGDGPLRLAIEQQIIETEMAHIVELVGVDVKVGPWFDIFDVFCLTSRKEGLPLALLEAMAAGRPAIVTDAGGMREAVKHGETGYVTRVGDAAAVAASLLTLLQNPNLRAEMGKRAKDRHREHFQRERMLKRTCEVYRDLLNVGFAARFIDLARASENPVEL